MAGKQDAVSFTVPFAHNGEHYLGVSALDGVGFELIDAPCGGARQLVRFLNCSYAPTGILADGVTAVVASTPAIRGYLKLRPTA